MKRIALFLLVWFCVSACFAEKLYKKEGVASFYGADFHGKKTSSGELFNMNDFTCANKELPFNTILKVTNLENGKTVNVRVNDRGPFVVGRDVDLSTAAAKKIEMTKSGTVKVRLDIVKLGENTKLSAATAESAKKIMEKKTGSTPSPKHHATKVDNTHYAENTVHVPKNTCDTRTEKLCDIQLASFSSRQNAEKFASELYENGFRNIAFQRRNDIIRVIIAKIPSRQVEPLAMRLLKAGYKDFVVRERRNS